MTGAEQGAKLLLEGAGEHIFSNQFFSDAQTFWPVKLVNLKEKISKIVKYTNKIMLQV